MGANLIAITPDAERVIEESGRVCYDSAPGDTGRFIQKLVRSGHESVLEHASATFEIECSRACSHQIVRHRIAGYSQRSQRYVREDKPQYIVPPSIAKNKLADVVFNNHMREAWKRYRQLLEMGIKPEDARYVLPNACRTKLRMTMNFRSWRHFIKERGANPRAQWEIQFIALQILSQLYKEAPSCFGDIYNTLCVEEKTNQEWDTSCL